MGQFHFDSSNREFKYRLKQFEAIILLRESILKCSCEFSFPIPSFDEA